MRINILAQALLAVVSLLFVYSCESPKRYAYLQDVELAKQYTVAHDRETVVSVGDRLSISVGSSFPELAAPFNGGALIGNAIAGLQGSNRVISSANTSDIQLQRDQQSFGYLVGQDGAISFPILGKVNIAGKTLSQIRSFLTDKIVESKYLTDPRVEVLLSNYTIYLLGAVGAGGVGNQTVQYNNYSMFTKISGVSGGRLVIYDRDRINIFEALSMSGDLPANARISKVNVIRNEGGKYTTYRLNMKSADIYNSPGFYLKSNDIVYVEPLYRRTEGIDRAMQLSSYAFSTITSVVAVLALLRKN